MAVVLGLVECTSVVFSSCGIVRTLIVVAVAP